MLTHTSVRGFHDRVEAGRRLADALLAAGESENAVVLALPRGGVEIGLEVAREIGAPLDVLIVRKLGVPWQPELAMGAIASDGVLFLNPDVVASTGIGPEEIDEIAATERQEVERREALYRAGSPGADVRGSTVIVVDDGLATGATMRAAVLAVRKRGPARVVVAVPIGSAESVRRLQLEADRVICPLVPAFFMAIGAWYEEFPQLSDDDVRRLLEEARRLPQARSGSPRRESGRPSSRADTTGA